MEKNLNIEDKESRVDEIEAGQVRTLILCPSLTSHLGGDDGGDVDDGHIDDQELFSSVLQASFLLWIELSQTRQE